MLLGEEDELLLDIEVVKDDGVLLVEEYCIEHGLLLSKEEVVLLGSEVGDDLGKNNEKLTGSEVGLLLRDNDGTLLGDKDGIKISSLWNKV